MIKKIARSIVIIIIILIIYIVSGFYEENINFENTINNLFQFEKVEVEKVILSSDKDSDGILDLDDIVEGARIDVQNKPIYKDKYYAGGYPPDNEGVCTDVVWRAFQNAGYNLKEMIDNDIKSNLRDYPRIAGESPDPNIDFRRVPNLISFFEKFATELTIEVISGDVENLKQWQGGDIVMFDRPYDHVAIVSDKRNNNGVPYIIHNAGPYTKEEDKLLFWHKNISKITHHFRYPKVD